MLFTLIKLPAKFAFWIYCRRLSVNHKELFKSKGPLLIAANHPNSFLDAVIIATLFKEPVYSLTRGDVFTNKLFARLLSSLNMFPVYRMSEGAENLEHNYKTFEQCKNVFKQNGIVLIFSEGRCINEWHLRPLKKGTARLAISAWREGIPLKILPVGINYSSFDAFGKNIQFNFGNVISEDDFDPDHSHGKSITDFNAGLQHHLNKLIVQIDKHDKAALKENFYWPQSVFKKTVLIIPAVFGWLFHFALFLPLKNFAWKKFAHNDHYDSVLIGLLFILYPLYLLLVSLTTFLIFGNWYWLLVFPLLPFFAWSHVQLKHQF